MEPAFPFGQPRQFRSTVHGTVFADRARAVQRIQVGDSLTLVVDPALRDPRPRGRDNRSSELLPGEDPEERFKENLETSPRGNPDASREEHPEESREESCEDKPGELSPEVVWVHLPSGEPVGHLPREIGRWLAPWMLQGGIARAHAIRVSGPDSPSWRRLLLQVSCG